LVIYDILVVGGGINGAGIARDAAGQGLSVLLVEKNDLGSATSSASSKLIHGGLRYLEQREFRLVRESLAEREVQLRAAPHLVWPLRFVLPHDPTLRPAWMIRLALLLYDRLGERQRLPASRGIDLRRAPEGAPLAPRFTRGFVYADCWCDDARLVIANCLDAAARGAVIRPRTALIAARRAHGHWQATLAGVAGEESVRARSLVNASGPWISRVAQLLEGARAGKRLRLVKGSHIVVDRVHDGDHAYIFQNVDRRVVFLLPFLERFSLIGTTEVPYAGDPAEVAIEEAEVSYLLAVANRMLKRTLSAENVRWTYAGVRPLFDDGSLDASTITRDYAFDLEAPGAAPPLLSVLGGKLTTYRRLAEHALLRLLPLLGKEPRRWTAAAPLPGGDMPGADFAPFAQRLAADHPALPQSLLRRYARHYGTRAAQLLDGVCAPADLGRDFGGGLHEREADFLRRTEWAENAGDILWRRTKQGLFMTADQRRVFAEWLSR
jgi:glycerol-3-phosphate dehydrogenase